MIAKRNKESLGAKPRSRRGLARLAKATLVAAALFAATGTASASNAADPTRFVCVDGYCYDLSGGGGGGYAIGSGTGGGGGGGATPGTGGTGGTGPREDWGDAGAGRGGSSGTTPPAPPPPPQPTTPPITVECVPTYLCDIFPDGGVSNCRMVLNCPAPPEPWGRWRPPIDT